MLVAVADVVGSVLGGLDEGSAGRGTLKVGGAWCDVKVFVHCLLLYQLEHRPNFYISQL